MAKIINMYKNSKNRIANQIRKLSKEYYIMIGDIYSRNVRVIGNQLR